MKRILALLLLTLFFSTDLLAQDSGDTIKKVCSYETFPIGAIRYPGDDSLLIKMFGMNFHWYGWASGNTPSTREQETKINSYNTNVRDPFYKDSNTTVNENDQQAMFSAAAHGKDIRIFMPGTCPETQEYNYSSSYHNRQGSILGTSPQWRIGGDTLTGDYALSDLSGAPNYGIPDATAEPYWGQGYKNTANHLGTYSYEFVFLIDTNSQSGLITEWNGAGVDDPLYSIEYWVKKDGESDFSFYVADTITKKSYRALKKADTQLPGRKVNADRLFTWTGLPSNINYRIQKRVLRIDTFFVDNDPGKSPKVDIRLRTFHVIPIFVRCIRIRDWVAQRLLTAKADVLITSAIGVAKAHSNNTSLKAWVVGNEPPYSSYHSFAYLNDLFVNAGAPPLSVLAPDNAMFVRIERDQSLYPSGKKMHLWHEWTPITGTWWRSRGLYETPAYWDFSAFPKRPMPITYVPTASAHADSIDWYKRSVFLESDYDTFTDQWQETILGYPSNSSGSGSGEISGMVNIAKACYETDPSHPIPYLGCYQNGASPIHNVPLYSVDSLRPHLVDSLGAERAFIVLDSLYETRIIDPYVNRHSSDSVLVVDSVSHLWWDWRASTEAEIRFQLWVGVCNGLKGYSVNMAFEDNGNNAGILWDSSGSIVKSYDRTQMWLDNWNGGYDGGTSRGRLVSPYRGRYYRSGAGFHFKSKLLPGFKEMYNGVKHTIQNELAPIVTTLATLKWIGSVSWHKRDSTPTYLSRLPIKNVIAKTLAGARDSAEKTYVQFGILKDPLDTIAVYVSAVNRRLWCDPKDTLTKDNRIITFQVDSNKFNKSVSNFTLWRITDVATKKDTIVTSRDTFSFTVKPGQGKLLKIAPAFGLRLGDMSKNLFNNARHIAPIEFNKDSVLGYACTYEKSGDIYVSYPTETPTGLSKRTQASPSDSLIAHDTTYALQTPAIAFDSATGKIGIVYCGIKSGAHDDDTAVIYFKSAVFASGKYNFNTSTALTAPFQVPKGYTPAPSIMPVNKAGGRSFWVGWTDTTNGGNIAIIAPGGGIGTSATFHIDRPRYAAYVSLAALKKFPDDVQIAYQECDEGLPNIGWLSHIFYTKAHYNSGSNSITVVKPRNISADFGHCLNTHPQICFNQKFMIDVTWEVTQGRHAVPDVWKEVLRHFVVFRSYVNGNWGRTLTAFFFDKDTLPVSVKDPIVLYPNILHSSVFNPNISSWSTIYRLMWNDPLTNTAAMALAGRADTVGGVPQMNGWEYYTMIEPSVEPSLPHISLGDRIVHPLLYRYPIINERGYYDARITQYDFPKTPIKKIGISKKQIAIQKAIPGTNSIPNCTPPPTGIVARPIIHSDTDISIIEFRRAASPGDDSTFVDSVGLNDYQHVRTESFLMKTGDTVEYGRYFRIGYNRGDTADAASNLVDTNDFLKMRILIRKVSDNSITKVLDSAVLKESGYTQSADTSNAGIAYYVVPAFVNDSVYISMEAAKGVDTNHYEVSQTEEYGNDEVIDMPPTIDSNIMAYKQSNPSAPIQSVVTSQPIKVTVIPNPFNVSTKINIDAPKDLELNVTIFDALGKPVTTFFNGVSEKRDHQFNFGDNTTASGIYYLRVSAGNNIVTWKIQLVK